MQWPVAESWGEIVDILARWRRNERLDVGENEEVPHA